MAIQNASDSQKVDYLWKKIVYGAAKTDISGNIDATNEPVASPLQIRADRILQQSNQIPGVIPASNSSVVTVYPTTFPVECTSTAGIPTPTLTWQSGRTFWVPPEFGSTYQIKVYIAPSGNAANVASKGTQVYATGSGSNDLWVFDYQSGILNFNSNNTPYSGASPISFTGNSVYISGAVYSGNIGLGNLSFVGSNISSNTDITISTTNNANIILNAGGTGIVQIQGTDAFSIPSGNILTRPTNPSAGYVRFNTDLHLLEYWNGSSWVYDSPAEITSQIINPNGVSNVYALTSNAVTAGVIVNINGTVQQPFTAYNVVGNNSIVFTEVPLTTDVVEVRTIATGVVSIDGLVYNDTRVSLDSANVNITGNLLPTANLTYSVGSSTNRWLLGYYGNIDITNNLTVGGSVTTAGNISGQYILGSGQFLTGLPTAYSNVNVKAYTETMGFQNYSNVNVKAYTETMGFQNYSNVNVAAYLPGYTGTLSASLINSSGNILSTGAIHNSLTVNGTTTTQTLIATGNVIGGLGQFAAINSTPIGNATPSTGAFTTLTATGNIGVTSAWVNAGTVNVLGNVLASAGTFSTGLFNSTTNSTGAGSGAVQVSGGMSINQDLWVLGNIYTANLVGVTTNVITITDSLLYLNRANTYPYNYSIGLYSHYIGGPANAYVHTTLVRQPNDNAWWFLSNIAEPNPATGNINVYDTNRILDTVNVGNLNVLGSGLLNVTGNVLASTYIGTIGVFSGNVIGGLGQFAAINSTPIGNATASTGAFTTLTATGNIGVTGAWVNAGTVNVTGNVLAAGGVYNSLTVNGNVTVTSAYAIPSANAASSLGTSATRWNYIYGVYGNFLSVNANYADLAEKYLADANYAPGTVVDFGGSAEVTQSTDDMSIRVAGVVSTNPGYVMNQGLEGAYVVILALAGRVKTKVVGPIRKGDMLVSNGDGRARAEFIPRTGSIIGKAIENFDGENGIIEVVVGVR